MKSKLVMACVLGSALLGVSGPVLAHHGNAEYEKKVSEFKQATVTKFAWAEKEEERKQNYETVLARTK